MQQIVSFITWTLSDGALLRLEAGAVAGGTAIALPPPGSGTGSTGF